MTLVHFKCGVGDAYINPDNVAYVLAVKNDNGKYGPGEYSEIGFPGASDNSIIVNGSVKQTVEALKMGF